jgi:hypothetical protein
MRGGLTPQRHTCIVKINRRVKLTTASAMASQHLLDLTAQLERLAAAASLDYQSFQLAAQRADLEGQALAAGVLRSISEGHAGKAHGLLTMLAGLEASDRNDEGTTAGFVRSAIVRAGDVEAISANLSREAKATLEPAVSEALDAIINLTSTNRPRLERLLAGLGVSKQNA